jgi:hypothetical protein
MQLSQPHRVTHYKYHGNYRTHKFFSVFSKHFLVTASNNSYSSSTEFNSSMNGGSLPTELTSKRVSVITFRFGATENRSSLVAQIVSLGTYFVFETLYPVTVLVYLLISWSLPSNGFTSYNTHTHTVGPKKMCTQFNVQNICLNNLLVYLRFNFENVGR